MPNFNIANRFGPLNAEAKILPDHEFPDFYRGFVAQLFGFDASPPATANLRASRSWEGGTRIIPLSFLASVALPVDYPRTSGDPLVVDEAELQARYQTNFPLEDLDVRLPPSGPPIISDAVTSAGFVRGNLVRLAAARALGLDEIAVRILYV